MINVTGTIAKSANIVKDSVVIGDVTIGEDCTVLFYAVLRGNDNKIVIGNGTNIQDNCTIHTSPVDPAIIGNHVRTEPRRLSADSLPARPLNIRRTTRLWHSLP